MIDDKDYIEALEEESQFLCRQLQRMAKRIAELRESRNTFWREKKELQAKIEAMWEEQAGEDA